MGASIFSHWKNSNGNSYKENPINPNPALFKIIRSVCIGDYHITEIKYPNCTNYEGRKILVTTDSLLDTDVIDPHFTYNSPYGLVARFVPTYEGWDMACKLATRMMQ